MLTTCHSLAALAAIGWFGASAVALAASDCPKEKVVDDAGKQMCGYVVTVLQIDSTASPRGLLELPTTVIVEAAAVFVPTIGWVVKDAYVAEQNRRYRAILRPAPEFKDYLRLTQQQNVWSTRRSAGYNFYEKDDHSVVYRWRLKKGGVGEGRAWLKTDLVLVSRHPNLNDWTEAEANELAQQSLAKLAQTRPTSKPKPTSAPSGSPMRRLPV